MAKQSKDEAQRHDAIAMLKADHQKVRDLILRYDAARDQRTKWELAAKVCIELELHAQVEENIFYPAFEEETNREGQDLVEESLKEHDAVETLIEELRTLKPEDALFQEKFDELRATVEHHVQEEEGRMFPEAERELEEQLEDLRDEMQELKQSLLAS
jgi:iron-sulfur cluster repair protein YtfE (RIC family)